MVSASKLIPIGIIALSLIIGLITFYIISDLPKQKRKEHVEEIVSQLINLIIFIWIGKIIVNFFVFIKDPLAILAYPSSSHAFYIAVVISIIVNLIKTNSRRIVEPRFIESLLLVFLVASFMYEFIQLVWNNNSFAFGYLVLSSILLVLFISSRGRREVHTLIVVIVTMWSGGMLLLSITQPFVTVFGYLMAPWFVCLIYLISMSIIIITKRKRDRGGRN
ncbi:hypothetical protein [Pseudalkalibacillus hwajinpoensis]|uniref:Uncharacterized protein n=1 Tax=Guptibacillus hwajinpoensis TaxID=208199 RepID=A0A4U1MNE4_9BACL|nr:hypothetical protein [Pseudalkalibacillus hwajinpoensis]TKD72281.1 hypothetical protein FBF83_05690 [Pseudalkalibacillus hwajinpoensis]